MRVAIIGSGLQCSRRAPVIVKCPDAKLVAIASLHLEHALAAAKQFGCEAYGSWEDIVTRDDVDVVLVCTPPHVHADIAIAAMKAGKHVLCEKPLTRTIEEATKMVEISEETGTILKCGFNHRHHPAIQEAKKLLDTGMLGKPLVARCRYGICGRPGFEDEWRANPELAAGGQYIEQGSHAIDLFRWFIGEIVEVSCMTGILYFQKQSLDDNGVAVYRSETGALASLHVSLTQWKNLFSLEIFCEDGYAIVDGLGASYGTERLIVGKRDFQAPFNDHVTEFRGSDQSWQKEWEEFYDAIISKRQPLGNGHDGLAAMRIALKSYEAERTRTVLKI